MTVMFTPGQRYSRKDVISFLGLPEDTWGGNWFTGYNEHEGDFFVFVNVGSPGRTGHDYGNEWLGDRLRWFAKKGTNIKQPQIQRLVDPSRTVNIFWRTDSNVPQFTYAGLGIPFDIQNASPVEVIWAFRTQQDISTYIGTDEVSSGVLREGLTKRVIINLVERNPQARKECLDFYGPECQVCGFSFEERYGFLGRGYIHVHHLIPLSTIGGEYQVDPITDLRPVCPNCHAMIHIIRPAMSLDELRNLLEKHLTP